MLTTFANRARMTTATTGTGTLTLGSALTGYLSFAEAGVANGSTVSYCIEDSNNIEIGHGVYTASGTTLTRNVIASKIHGEAIDTTPISLSGSARVFLTLLAEDIRNLTGPYFNVQEFGATGDGTADDSAAIQAALDAAAAGSQKRVYVPHTANGYAIGSTLTIDEGVTLFGDNLWGQERSRIKPRPGFTSPLLRTEDYGVTRKLRVGIIGLFFDGSSTTLTAIQANIQESLIQNCTVKNCFTYGIHFGGISSGPTAQALNNHILDNYLAGQIGVTEFFDGIFIDYFSADNTIERNYIEASKDAGIRSRGYNNKITNNHIYSVAGTGGGVGAGIYTETSADHDISQNYIELCAAEGVLMQGGGSDVATLAAGIHGNVFRNIDTGNTSNGVIEIAGSDVSAVSVSGNVVRRDAATSYATPYFVYFNGIAPTLQTVIGNSWQSGLVTIDESNLPQLPGLSLVNLTQTGYQDIAEIAAPASPASNVARVYAVDDGAGVTTMSMKDSAGNVVLLSHFLQSGTGAITRTNQGKLRDVISAFDFIPVAEQAAILAGTSTTDVFSYLRSAATAAAGGTLLLPEGLYNCSDDVPIPANTHVIGYGATIKATNGNVSNPVLIEIANHAGNVLIEGVTFDGNIANIAGLNNVVTVFTTAAVRFENCKWQNCKGIAVIFSTVTRSGVRNSIFDTNGNYDLTSASLADRRAGIVFTGTCQYCFANYNRLEDTGLDSISATTGSSDLEVIGNVIEGTRAACIFVSNTVRPIIANNICTGAVTPSDLSGGVGIDIPDTTDGVVTGNICHLNDSAGILLADAKRMTVVGNICKNNSLATSFTPNHLGGICIAVTSGDTVRDLTLTGNQCYDDRAAASVKQRFAIGVLDGGGSFVDIRIDKSNRLIGYDSSGNETATDVFQTGDLGYSGRDFGRRDQDLPAQQRYDAENNATAPTRVGVAAVASDGTATAVNKASTNYYTRQSRIRSPSAASTGANGGTRFREFKFRQDAARTSIRFGWEDFATNAAAFIGLKGDAAHGNADPSSFINCIGIGIDSGQTTWRLLHNDGSGSATATDLGANFPANTDATDFYELEIWWGDAAATVHWKLTRCNTGHIARGQIDTNLTSLTTTLNSHVICNTRTGSAAIDLAYASVINEFS